MSTVAIASIAAAGIGAAGSIASGAMQAGAAESAAALQAQEAANSLAFQKQEFATQQANQAPFLQAGQKAITTLSDLTSTPGQGLLTPFSQTFTPPTAAEARATPGYQFTLQQGEEALQNSAAASGGLLSGGTAKSAINYAEGLADTTYQQQFNNALESYRTAYNVFQGNQANTYNRLAGVAGTGQTAANQLGIEGQQAAQGVSNINLTTGQLQGQDIMAGAAATASGYAGAANALSGGISNIAGALTLQQILNGGGGTNPNDISGLFAPGTPGVSY